MKAEKSFTFYFLILTLCFQYNVTIPKIKQYSVNYQKISKIIKSIIERNTIKVSVGQEY